jgi:hypothetical protein
VRTSAFVSIVAVASQVSARRVGGAAGPDFGDIAERGIDGATDRASGIDRGDHRANGAAQSTELVVEAIAVADAGGEFIR